MGAAKVGRVMAAGEGKHTPLPWAKDKYGSLKGPDGKVITVWRLGIAHGQRTEETEANAKLLEAAPELLKALKALMEDEYLQKRIEQTKRGIGIAVPYGEVIVNALAVIARAEGRS